MAGREAHAWRGHILSTCAADSVSEHEQIHTAQVPPTTRSDCAHSSIARAYDLTTVGVCMLRRLKAYMEVCCVLAAVLFMVRHCCRLCQSTTKDVACSSRRPRSGHQLAVLLLLGPKKLGRWDARRSRIALCAALCVSWVFHHTQAASACLNVHPHACLRHGTRQRLRGDGCAAA